jgi:glycosyltransferase involved in cell wall biosynthesis
MPSLLGMTNSAFDPASRVRLIQFIPGLEKAGWKVDHRPNVPDRQWKSSLPGRWSRAAHYRIGRLQMKWNRWRDVSQAGRFDAVFVNRDLAGGGLLFEKRLLSRNPRVVFDFDDAIFIGRNEKAVAWMCSHAAWVTPGNEYLAGFARRFTPRVTVVPTVIDVDRYTPAAPRPPGAPVRVGWSGSDQSISAALFPFLPMLEGLQDRLGFEFVIVTNTRPRLPVSRLRFTFVPWKAEEEGELGRHMDIGLMPLVDDAFQRGKCGLKLLQYMAAALPTVASPVGVNAHITVHGETGFLARSDAEWAAALEPLVRSEERRVAFGRNGRQRCQRDYSVERWLPELIGIFREISGPRCPGTGRIP